MSELKVLDEKSLQLVVSNEQLGSLTTNAEKIRDLVKSRIGDYSIDNYDESNIDKAKADKALLNKAKKALNDERIKLEKSFMQPFMGFKDIVNETVKLIDKAVKDIDTVVKASEEKAKSEKREQIEHLAEDAGLEEVGVKLSLIFNDKWLNKTVSLKKVKQELDEKVSSIKSDLETLKTFSEDYDALVVRYKENLDLKETVAYANQLKAQRENHSDNTETPTEKTEPPTEKVSPKYHVVDDADDAFAAALGQDAELNISTHTLDITASEDDMAKVIDFLDDNNIEYQIR